MTRAGDSRSMNRRRIKHGAGTADARKEPRAGWKSAAAFGWSNPRPPAVPATLQLSIDEYFAAASLIGLLSAQTEEPNQRWVCDWSFKMGRTMAKAARKQRRAKS
jgi:hypothetical protein